MGHFRDRRAESGVAPAQLHVLAPPLFFAASFASLWFPWPSPDFRVTPKLNGPLNTFLRTPFTPIRRP
jgi:hypothetical protein